ncbi:MAG: hypothetical protein F4Y03_13400 [Alphaproteobacteria bacterium]|nr:hypothetical protein [Alphaproteobacteria bacterium]
MPGLVPGIHAAVRRKRRRDTRNKSGYDDMRVRRGRSTETNCRGRPCRAGPGRRRRASRGGARPKRIAGASPPGESNQPKRTADPAFRATNAQPRWTLPDSARTSPVCSPGAPVSQPLLPQRSAALGGQGGISFIRFVSARSSASIWGRRSGMPRVSGKNT